MICTGRGSTAGSRPVFLIFVLTLLLTLILPLGSCSFSRLDIQERAFQEIDSRLNSYTVEHFESHRVCRYISTSVLS